MGNFGITDTGSYFLLDLSSGDLHSGPHAYEARTLPLSCLLSLTFALLTGDLEGSLGPGMLLIISHW